MADASNTRTLFFGLIGGIALILMLNFFTDDLAINYGIARDANKTSYYAELNSSLQNLSGTVMPIADTLQSQDTSVFSLLQGGLQVVWAAVKLPLVLVKILFSTISYWLTLIPLPPMLIVALFTSLIIYLLFLVVSSALPHDR